MRVRIRWFGLGLVLMILVSMSISLVAARSFPIDWRDLQPGMREQGSWIFCIAGNHCHNLLPIYPLFPGKQDPPKNGSGTSAASTSSSSRPQTRKIGEGGAANASRQVPSVSWKGSGPENVDGGTPLVNIQTGARVSASTHVGRLEDGLRDAISRLNTR